MPSPKKRRQYGSGSVYQRKDGRWVGTFDSGFTVSGARRRKVVYGSTKAEAKAKLKEKMRQDSDEQHAADIDIRTTVKAWSDTWLEMTQRTLRPKPWATDRSAVRKWIVPTIGHKRLTQLTPADMRAVAAAQRAAGLSTSTHLRTHTTLTAMLRAAILEGHRVPRNVLDVKSPEKAANDRTPMSIPEALAVLQVASHLAHGSRWAMAFLHGMRQGECLGLTWDCVNLDVGMVTVEWELQTVPYIDRADRSKGFRIPDGLAHRRLVDSYHLLPPKTKKGFRVIPLVPAMREALADWKEVAPENEWGLVWSTSVGRPIYEKHDREEFWALQGTASMATLEDFGDLAQIRVGHPSGRYYHPHELRHGTATELLDAGVDPHQITALMGHSSVLTTRGYQHPSQRAGLAALEQLAERFGMGPRELRPPD